MRTTQEKVEAIIDVNEGVDLIPFMAVANELVTECCVDSGYTDARLELIETWLSAHLYAIKDMRPSSESIGDVSINYQYKVGLYLEATMYGQQAMILDTFGNLAEISKRMEGGGIKKAIDITWVGTDDDDEETITD